MTFKADYPGAIVVEAANYGYKTKNHPKGFVYHTPEEKADDDPQTPGYLAGTTRNASYTYFVSYLGFVFQLVPEIEGAYANFVNGKPYPSWANPAINLNLQSISISFEGYAATVHLTMSRGKSQWNAGVALVAHRAKALSINPDNWVGHKDVSIARSDPGRLNLAAFTQDVKAKMKGEDEVLTQEDKQWIYDELQTITKHLDGRVAVTASGGKHIHSPSKVGMELFGFKREFPNDQEHQAIHAIGYIDTPITDAQWDDLENFPFSGGSDASATQIAKAVNDDHARRMAD